MQKIIEKGDEFAATENKRLQKLLNGKISMDKKKELQHRLNILQIFLQYKQKGSKGEL